MKYCCSDFEYEADSFSGYFVYEGNEWWIFTDAEGGRYLLNKSLKFCPFCGADLSKEGGEEKFQ
jgi:hypothetical protein